MATKRDNDTPQTSAMFKQIKSETVLYTKTGIDTILEGYATTGDLDDYVLTTTFNTATGDLDTNINKKADASGVYTKDEIDGMVGSVYRIKGSKQSYSELVAMTGQRPGDVYNVKDNGMNYVWVENDEEDPSAYWDAFAPSIDTSNYYTKAEITANYYAKSDISAAITTVTANSNTWRNASNAVTANSGKWNDASNAVTDGSANWNNTYSWATGASSDLDNLSTSATNWNNVYTTVYSNSASWDGAASAVYEGSGNWNSVYSEVNSGSANWNSAYNKVSLSSGNWDNAYNKVSLSSGNWDNAYNNVVENSGKWNDTCISVSAGSANWNDAYGAVTAGSANWNNTHAAVTAGSAKWNNASNAVTANSANWNKGYDGYQDLASMRNNVAVYTSAAASTSATAPASAQAFVGGFTQFPTTNYTLEELVSHYNRTLKALESLMIYLPET